MPIAYLLHLKKIYNYIKLLFAAIKYNTYKQRLYGYLKVIDIRGEYTKYYWFLCVWDSCATADHYIIYNIGVNTFFMNLLNSVQKQTVLFPLHINLGIIKIVVKVMGKINYGGFQYFKEKFLKIGATKLKEDIFIELSLKVLQKTLILYIILIYLNKKDGKLYELVKISQGITMCLHTWMEFKICRDI